MSTGRPAGESNSTLRCDDLSKFETVFCIEYENDETLEIKDEVIQDQGIVTSRKCDENYEKKSFTVNLRETNILAAKKKLRTNNKKQKCQKLKPEKKYKCEKCGRSYTQIGNLTRHKKLECDVMPQFKCNFCDKRFKRNPNLRRHIVQVHQKKLEAPLKKYNCIKCSRSYTWPNDLYKHERLEHSGLKPKFTCDFCGRRMKEKGNLAQHIALKHLNKS
ncbi:zinc finger protein 726-like [Belonocnema kinseyi]|uniref:zinc finger protein 726-like n=1 Tax=Belonocnema kinseyi TaxID=2817044 RepID=UPI00143CEC38|nr:zinc finger protein 726-like [Belonocnema kinseyi]